MRVSIISFFATLVLFLGGKTSAYAQEEYQVDLSFVNYFDIASNPVYAPYSGGDVYLDFELVSPTPINILLPHIQDAISDAGCDSFITDVSVTNFSGNLSGTLVLTYDENMTGERDVILTASQSDVLIIQYGTPSSVFTLSANKSTIFHGEDITFTLNGSNTYASYNLLRSGSIITSCQGTGTALVFHETGTGIYTAESDYPSQVAMNGSVTVSYLAFYGYNHSFTQSLVSADKNGGVYTVSFTPNASASTAQLSSILTAYNNGNSSTWNPNVQVSYSSGTLTFRCGPNLTGQPILNNTWFKNNSSNTIVVSQPAGGELISYSATTQGSNMVLSGSQLLVSYRLMKEGQQAPVSTITGTGNALSFPAPSSPGIYTIEAEYDGVRKQMTGGIVVGESGVILDKDANWIISEKATESTGLTNPVRDITYFDGLGYQEQTINVAASPTGGNIVTPFWYDDVRRPDAKTYLPYVSSSSTPSRETSPFSAQQSYYSVLYGSSDSAYAFDEKTYQASPLDRVSVQKKPGAIFRTDDKDIVYAYDSNAASSVFRIDFDASNESITVNGYYSAGVLHSLSTTDEDGRTVILFTDKTGKVILSRAIDGSSMQDTYTVFDGLGRVRWVIQPEGSSLLQNNSTWTIDTNNANDYAFRYTYDGLGRLTETRCPGKDVTYSIYDPMGRLVATQDGNLRSQGRWILIKYNAFGEEELRYLTGSNVFSRTTLESEFDNSAYPSTVYDATTNVVLEYSVYGSYPSWAPSFANESGVVSSADLRNSTKGFLTGKEVADLSTLGSGTVTYVRRAFYYDKRGRLRQTVESYPDGGTLFRESLMYDYQGNQTRKKDVVSGTGLMAKTLDETVTYDARGRKTASSASLGNSTASVSYSYDGLGRLTSTTLGSITQSDTYNIQGWQTGLTAIKGSSTIYAQTLRYYSPSLGATPQYSGIISEWVASNGNTTGTYGLTYDGFGRLSSSLHFAGTSTTGNDAFTERDITYDKNGNILTLKRYGSSASTPQDNFTYSYSGNKLSSLSGTANVSFAYDSNGNMVTDGLNGNTLGYNLLDRISTVHQGSTLKATYQILADGTKYKALDGSNNGLVYVGPFVYSSSGSLESAATCNGDARFITSGGTATPYYYITDHLGSIRVVVDGSGNVMERNDYYPYGLRHTSGASYPTLSANRQKFSGKELQSLSSSVSLSYLDYGARFYDPALARWGNPDPMQERYYPFSPFAFCAGNPVYLVDFDGRVPRIYIQTKGVGHAFITTGEGRNTTVYTFGRYGALNESSGRTFGRYTPKGEGTLGLLKGRRAMEYLNHVQEEKSFSVFELPYGKDAIIDAYFQDLYENGTQATGGIAKEDPCFRVIGEYNLIMNNCVITTVHAAEVGGTRIIWQAVTPMKQGIYLKLQALLSNDIIELSPITFLNSLLSTMDDFTDESSTKD